MVIMHAHVFLSVTPHTQCRLKLLKQERIKDYLLMEEEFIRNQEQMKPLEEKQEVGHSSILPPVFKGLLFNYNNCTTMVCLWVFCAGGKVKGG